MKNLYKIVFFLISALIISLGKAQSAGEATTVLQPIPIERLDPDSAHRYNSHYAAWETPGGEIIEAVYGCSARYLLDVLPIGSTCSGYITKSLSTDEIVRRHADEVAAQTKRMESRVDYFWDKSLLRDRQEAELGKFREKSRLLSLERNYDLFKQLYAEQPAIVSANGELYELNNFHLITANAISNIERAEEELVAAKRLLVAATAVSVVVLFLAFFYIYKKAIRLLNRILIPMAITKLKAARVSILDKSLARQRARDERVFREALIDEAAREITRRAFDAAEDSERGKELKNAIAVAGQSGSEELVEARRSSLKNDSTHKK